MATTTQLQMAALLPDMIVPESMPKQRKASTLSPTAAITPKSVKPHIIDIEMNASNWYKHINWLNVTVLILIPSAALYTAISTPLQLKTAIWAVAYYFITGIGITAGTSREHPTITIEFQLIGTQDITVYGLTNRTAQQRL